MPKTLFVILDGAADLGSKTALSKARKPHLDFLAQNSYCGLWTAKLPKGYNLASFSDVAILQLLGCYEYPGRGYLEALGTGLKPKKGSICFRANFGTAKRIENEKKKNSKKSQIVNLQASKACLRCQTTELFEHFASQNSYHIIDRRAGRDETGLDELAKAVNKIKLKTVKGVKAKFYRSVGHRGILVLEGKNLAPIEDIDTGSGLNMPKVFPGKTPKTVVRTALVVAEFMNKAYEILDKHKANKKRNKKANFVLLRGAGSVMKVNGFKERFGLKACAISGVGITKGIARFLGMDVVDVKGATGHFDTNLDGKLKAVLNALGKYDFIVLHVNGADEAGHDKNFMKKKKFIEMVDEKIFSRIVQIKEVNKVVAIDHITSCKTGKHTAGSVPFLIYVAGENSNKTEDSPRGPFIIKFDESHCKKGFRTNNPMERVMLMIKK